MAYCFVFNQNTTIKIVHTLNEYSLHSCAVSSKVMYHFDAPTNTVSLAIAAVTSFPFRVVWFWPQKVNTVTQLLAVSSFPREDGCV